MATSTISTGGLTIGINQFVVQQNSGNIGMGIATPSAKLQILGADILNTNQALNVSGSSGTGLVVTNAGNVGIGTSTPTYTLQVQPNGGTANQTLFIQDATAITGKTNVLIQPGAGQLATNPLLTLDQSGQAVDAEALRLNYANGLNLTSHISWYAGNGLTETQRITAGLGATITNGYMAFSTYNSDINGLGERMRIDGHGNVGIGTTSPWGKLAIVQSSNDQNGGLTLSPTPQSGNSYRSLWMSTDGTLSFQSTTTTATLTTTGVWTNSSDAAYKYNVADLRYGLATAMQLEPREFNYKANGQPGLGFIAQELQNTIPEVVYGTSGSMTVDYGSLSAVALNAIKQIGGAVDVLDALNGTSTLKSSYRGVDLPAITVDAFGNASFVGQVTASGFNVKDIGTSLANLNQISSSTSLTLESLENSLNILASTTDKLVLNFADLSDRLKILETAKTASSTGAIDINAMFGNPNGLTIDAPLTLNNGLHVDQISSVSDYLSLMSDTEFIGRPYFTKDTAGFAVVKAGSREVEVTFDREYLEQPIVNTTISFDAASSTDSTGSPQAATSTMPVGGNNIEEQIFSNDVRFLVTNKSEKGFTILLNKPAPTDVPFSWTALAVKSAKVFSSIAVPTMRYFRTITIISCHYRTLCQKLPEFLLLPFLTHQLRHRQ